MRAGGPGRWHLLPLGLRARTKLERLIVRELERVGCQQVSLPLVPPAQLWKQSGRLDTMGSELITFTDRQNRQQVLSPTHEEAVTALVASFPVTTERDLPLKLFQIGTKFRDEMRPKLGLIRASEFLMKDLYTFDKSLEAAQRTYEEIREAYRQAALKLIIKCVQFVHCLGHGQPSNLQRHHIAI